MFQIVSDRFEGLQMTTVDDHRAGGRVVADARKHAPAVGEIYRHLDGAALGEPTPGNEKVDGVRQHHQHRLLRGNLQGRNAVRQPVRLPVEGCVGQRGPPTARTASLSG